jgi:hypothetical protein
MRDHPPVDARGLRPRTPAPAAREMSPILTEAQTAGLVCAGLFASRSDEEVWAALSDASEVNAEAMEARDFDRASWALAVMEALTKEVRRRAIEGGVPCPVL